MEIGKTRNCMETRRPKGGVFSYNFEFSQLPRVLVAITIYQYGKNVLYFFYNMTMSKARRIRKISVFTSGGKFPVLTLSYINTALSQSAFRIYKCYIIINKYKTFSVLIYSYINTSGIGKTRNHTISSFPNFHEC